MRRRTPEALYESAQLTREMIALVERYFDGKATRQALQIWAYKVEPRVFRNFWADNLYTCLCRIDGTRDQDLAYHLAAVRAGEPPFAEDSIATLKLTVEEIAQRTHRPTFRFWFEGLGEFEGVRFASPATGTPFLAGISLYHPRDTGVTTTPRSMEPEAKLEVIGDLFDTLVIDTDDCTWIDGPPPPTWRLMRLDDNVNSFEIATFTGYAKARAALANFEAKQHKQSYWLEIV